MTRASVSILLWLISITCYAQSKSTTICRLGFTYEISKSPNWGNGEVIVTGITSYSSAEYVGLKPGDIIKSINGVRLTEVTPADIPALLNAPNKSEITLTIANLSTDSKQVKVKKECKKSNSITEGWLATAFNMYSLETTSERKFICPFKITTTQDSVSFRNFKTFSFAAIDENNHKLETIINECIQKELTAKGMKRDDNQPDLLVETYYFFDKNPNYKGANKILVEKNPTYRYNIIQNKIVQMPFLSSSSSSTEAEYLLQLGFRLVDQKEHPGRLLWECESNELLENTYKLDDYARTHIPLMCMQYPYLKYQTNVPFVVNQKTYNYTGISYDIDRLELISEVNRNSPGYSAGIRQGDVIETINNIPMNHSAEEFTAAYKQFISSTMQYRDASTRFTDTNGFKQCMFWNKQEYPEISYSIQEEDNMAAFAYLYYFAPYINPSGNNVSTFHIMRGKNKMEIIIRPTVRTELTVEIK